MTRRVAGIAKLVAASGISWAGDWALNIAASVDVFRRTDSALAVSMLLALAAAPAIALGPIAGAVADRYDRRKVMLAADLTSCLVLLSALPLLDTTVHLPTVYVCVLAIGMLSTFHRPASEAMLPSLAHPEQLSRANSALRLAQRLGFIGGPAAAAWLVDRGGVEAVFVIDAASFVVSSTFIAAIPRVPRITTQAAESPFQSALSGMAYARDRQNLRIVISSVGITMLVAPIVNAGTVIFVSDELHQNESVYGWLLTAQGVGAIALAAALIGLGARTPLLPAGILSLVVTGSAVLLLSAAQALITALFAMALMGMGVVGLQVAFSSYLQRESADQYRGRVMSLVAVIANVGNLVGLALTPVAVLVLGVRPAFVLTGAIIVLSALPIVALSRQPARPLATEASETPRRPDTRSGLR